MTSRVLIGLESTLLLRKKPALDRKNRNGAWNARHEHGNRWHLTTVPVGGGAGGLPTGGGGAAAGGRGGERPLRRFSGSKAANFPEQRGRFSGAVVTDSARPNRIAPEIPVERGYVTTARHWN